jgi:hypothetical protein
MNNYTYMYIFFLCIFLYLACNKYILITENFIKRTSRPRLGYRYFSIVLQNELVIYCTAPWTSSSRVFTTDSAFHLGFAKERVERLCPPSNGPSGNIHLLLGQHVASELRVERACTRLKIRKRLPAHIISVVQPYVTLHYVTRSKYM